MPDIERRSIFVPKQELRVIRRESGPPVIEGYAAKFEMLSEDLGGFREKISRKFFNDCITRCDVRCLRNHDPDKLLGRSRSGSLEMSTDDTGLAFKCVMRGTQCGMDTMADIESGDMDGCSFSFTTDDPDGDDWDYSTSPPTRTLLRCRDLYDVGPVTYPAYLDTSVSARSLELARRGAVIVPHPRKVLKSRALRLRLGRALT